MAGNQTAGARKARRCRGQRIHYAELGKACGREFWEEKIMASTYIPVVVSALLSPNSAQASQPVLISVAAIDVECVPSAQAAAGEFTSGEV